MVAGSKLSACHISVLFTAVLGRKLQPNGQGIDANHSLARSALHCSIIRPCPQTPRIQSGS